MDSDRGDHNSSNKEETKINIISPSDNLATVTPKEESNKNLQVNSGVEDAAAEASEEKAKNNSDLVVTKLTPQSQQEVEPVTEVVTDPVTTPVTPSREDLNRKINWQSYPYNSSDVNTLKNRALKVKERVLQCSTHNDLIKLLAFHKASEPEINWLRENYVTEGERAQLQQIENSTQGNLFSQPESNSFMEMIKYRNPEIIESIDQEMKRLGWSKEQGRQYLISTYGKKSRLHLSDSQLLEFWEYLKQSVRINNPKNQSIINQ